MLEFELELNVALLVKNVLCALPIFTDHSLAIIFRSNNFVQNPFLELSQSLPSSMSDYEPCHRLQENVNASLPQSKVVVLIDVPVRSSL